MTRDHNCSIPVIHILSEHFEPFFISSWLLSTDDVKILHLAWDSALRIISRLRFSFVGTKISEKSRWEFGSNKWEDGVLSCSPETAAVLVIPNAVQEEKATLASTQCSTPKEGDGGSPAWKEGWGLTGASHSDLCQIIIHHDYTGPITAVRFFLPTVRCLYLYFDIFR